MTILNNAPLICNINEASVILSETKYGEHILVMYDDIATMQELYCIAAMNRLPINKEAILLLPYLETPGKVRQTLENKGLRVNEYQKDGSLAIIDAYHWFFEAGLSARELLSKMISDLKREGKEGLTIIQDIGVFFLLLETDKLIGSELRHRTDDTAGRKMICCIHKGDYERLPVAHREVLALNHDRSLAITNSSTIIFEEALAQSVSEAMAIYGRQVSQIVSNYLEKKHSIPPRSLGENPQALAEALQNALDSGARIVERRILRSLFEKLGSQQPSQPTNFEDAISKAKIEFQNYRR